MTRNKMMLKDELVKELSKPSTILYCILAFLIGSLIVSRLFTIKEVAILAIGFCGFSCILMTLEEKKDVGKSDN